MAKGCGLVTCPSCGFEFPPDSKVVSLLTNLVRKVSRYASGPGPLKAEERQGLSAPSPQQNTLADARPGDRALVCEVFASDARVDRLAALGIVPGIEVRVHQHRPVVIIECGETTLALEREIAAHIVVSAIPPKAAA